MESTRATVFHCMSFVVRTIREEKFRVFCSSKLIGGIFSSSCGKQLSAEQFSRFEKLSGSRGGAVALLECNNRKRWEKWLPIFLVKTSSCFLVVFYDSIWIYKWFLAKFAFRRTILTTKFQRWTFNVGRTKNCRAKRRFVKLALSFRYWSFILFLSCWLLYGKCLELCDITIRTAIAIHIWMINYTLHSPFSSVFPWVESYIDDTYSFFFKKENGRLRKEFV